jgi:guanylate kinase
MGPLILVSGPSGSGKSTLIRHVLDQGRYPLRLAVSATTRPPRAGERDGVEYYFWPRKRFEEELAAGAFLEHAEVHGNLYGTPRSEVDSFRARGMGVVLDIDVQGAAQVRPLYPEVVTVFVELPRWEMYEERIRARGTEDEASLARRLETARRELAQAGGYQHRIVNADLSQAAAELEELVSRQFIRRGSRG